VSDTDFSFEKLANDESYIPPPGKRMLQTSTSGSTNTYRTTESKPWGIIYFYMDGRIRELLSNGTSVWNN